LPGASGLQKELVNNEEKPKNTDKHRRETQTRIPQQNGDKARQEDNSSPPPKRQKSAIPVMLRKFSIQLITIYQGSIRYLLPVACRFTPSCSEYAKQAILKYGFLQGSHLALKRILACHPFSGKAGYDPLT